MDKRLKDKQLLHILHIKTDLLHFYISFRTAINSFRTGQTLEHYTYSWGIWKKNLWYKRFVLVDNQSDPCQT